MSNRSWRRSVLTPLFFAFLFTSTPFAGDEPSHVTVRGVKIPVTGTLERVDGVQRLTTWGSPWQQGFAHGYLLKDEVIGLYSAFLESGRMMKPAEYEFARAHLGIMHLDAEAGAELRGMLEGLEAAHGGPIPFDALGGRHLRYDDLVMANCMGDLTRLRLHCSSFAAWGDLTEGGKTISGRNYEWPRVDALVDSQVVFIRKPPPGSDALGTVSVLFPSQIGIITGMNEEGVTVATHDSHTNQPTRNYGFTPICLLYRRVLETARAATAGEDIATLLRTRGTITGNNMMVTRPSEGIRTGGFVFEHDSMKTLENGFTLRKAKEGETFLASTNCYQLRKSLPDRGRYNCTRYATYRRNLEMIARAGGDEHIDVDTAWFLLESGSLKNIATYHRMVFEPDRRLMHAAFPESKKMTGSITLDVAKLLEGAKTGAGVAR